MIEWWLVEFTLPEGKTGYQKMQNGECLGVYFTNGTVAEGNIEYTTIDTNAPAPDWA